MKNKAKVAGQGRHTLTTLGGGILADALAGAELINGTLAELGIDLNLDPTQEIVLGLAVSALGFVMSWRDRSKKIGEGDLE